MIKAFPSGAKTAPYSLTATASSSTALPAIGKKVRLVNPGPNNAFISIGPGSQTATLPNSTPTNTSTPILAGTDIVLELENEAQMYISGICATGQTATIYASVGDGV